MDWAICGRFHSKAGATAYAVSDPHRVIPDLSAMWCVYGIFVIEASSSLSQYMSINWQNVFMCHTLEVEPINMLLLYILMHICGLPSWH